MKWKALRMMSQHLARIFRLMVLPVTEGGTGDQEGKPGLMGAMDLGNIWVALWSKKLVLQKSSKVRFGQTAIKAKAVCDVN